MANAIQQLAEALFLDLPYVVDSLFRRIEYRSNRLYVFQVHSTTGTVSCRKRKFNPATGLLILTAVFVLYGPTFDAMCSIAGQWFAGLLLQIGAYLVFALGLIATYALWVAVGKRIQRRVGKLKRRAEKAQVDEPRLRIRVFKGAAYILALALTLVPTVTVLWNGLAIADAPDFCFQANQYWTAVVQFALVFAIAASAAAVAYMTTRSSVKVILRLHFLFFVAVLIFLLGITPFNPNGLSTREAEFLPYIHIYAIIVAAIFVVPLVGSWMARIAFQKFAEHFPLEKGFAEQLKKTELFEIRSYPKLSIPRTLYGLILGPLHYPLLLLLLPALVALTAPLAYLTLFFWLAFWAGYLLLIWGSISQRWNRMIIFTSRYFFQGLPFAVSLFVIVIGIARMLGVQYVSTVLDVAPFGAVTFIVVMLYLALWLFNYWQNRPLQLRLMQILGAAPDEPDRLRYPYIPYGGKRKTGVLEDDRELQVHGAAGFVVVGKYQRGSEWGNAFHTWNAVDLFQEIAHQSQCELDPDDHRDLVLASHALRRRVLLYRTVMNFGALFMIAAAIGIVMFINGNHREPIVSARETGAQAGGFNLAEELRRRGKDGRPAVFVAASGGGTRAALYTYAVLRGLAQRELADDIVLGSGVSGGGVALAYFASHYTELANPPWREEPWQQFRERISSRFVSDVLEGVLEPRVYGKITLGALLKESFDRRFGDRENRTFKEAPFGLILNTTLTAHPYEDSTFLGRLYRNWPMFADAKRRNPKDYGYITFRGGRLVFTNVALNDGFPEIGRISPIAPDIFLPYRVVRDDAVELVAAAALNANFPPVFPDGLVAIRAESGQEIQRYYVTDGGATDNRGLISLLYALRGALGELKKSGDVPPPVYILVAEASALSFDYTSPFGLGAAFSGAKAVLASGLLTELFEDAQALHKRDRGPTLDLFYLPMPSVFRTRGGLGTHWMMPTKVPIANPYEAKPSWRTVVHTITDHEFKCLVEQLYADAHSECKDVLNPENTVIQQIRKWICMPQATGLCESPNQHAEAWREFESR